jgi:hypothetical protein
MKGAVCMNNRLIFQGYASQDLDAIAALFIQRTGQVPECFIMRDGWQSTGSDENTSKVIFSDLAGNGCVFVPLVLTLKEFLSIESERKERKYYMQPSGGYFGSHQSEKPVEVSIRYCSYCGRIFRYDPKNFVIHCGLDACRKMHTDYIQAIKKEKEESLDRVRAIGGSNKNPDFSLDNPTPRNTSSMGWVYFITAENDLVKIGKSDDLHKRFSELITASPVRLRLTHAVACVNRHKVEIWLHEQFAAKKDHGEWYGLSPEDIEWAETLHDYDLDAV